MSKRKHEEANSLLTEPNLLFESTPIHDRSSTFTAIFTPSTTAPRSLQRHQPFESAGHKILAWRKPSGQKSLAASFTTSTPASDASTQRASQIQPGRILWETGSDDDGEKWAGRKLENVLTDMDVQGTVVVARWYGGVLLGPVRFKWIEDSAREAILKWKASVEGETGQAGETKKVKVEKESQPSSGQERERLVRVLNERDASVGVLRGLLAEKNDELNGIKVEDESEKIDTEQVSARSPSTIVPDYDSMPVERLRQLEKARDATLTWILKQIDAVEEKIKAQKSSGESKG